MKAQTCFFCLTTSKLQRPALRKTLTRNQLTVCYWLFYSQLYSAVFSRRFVRGNMVPCACGWETQENLRPAPTHGRWTSGGRSRSCPPRRCSWGEHSVLKFDINSGTVCVCLSMCMYVKREGDLTNYIKYFVNICNIQARSEKLNMGF